MLNMDLIKFQQSLFVKSQTNVEAVFDNLYGLICRKDVIDIAFDSTIRKKGSKSPGVDGIKKDNIGNVENFKEVLIRELKDGSFKPLPVREVLIPKPKGGLRPLGVPAIKDRVVQAALKLILEPIFEGTFSKYSFGFRPKRNVHQACKLIHSMASESVKMHWIVEGDIKNYFNTVNHNILLKLIEAKVKDRKLISLIRKFLKAGILRKSLFFKSKDGVPQGGILSPLLANIYLNEFDKFFYKYQDLGTKERRNRRRNGLGNIMYVRYADDFVIMTNGGKDFALELKKEAKEFLDTIKLTLSDTKTKITNVNDGFEFLGFKFVRKKGMHKTYTKMIPKPDNIRKFKEKIGKIFFKGKVNRSIDSALIAAGRVISGWGNYYKYCNGVNSLYNQLDNHVYNVAVDFMSRKLKSKSRAVIIKSMKKGFVNYKRTTLNRLSDINTGFFKDTYFPEYEPTLRTVSKGAIPNLTTYWSGDEKRGNNWGDIRLRIFERDNYTCTSCNTHLNRHQLECHHKKDWREFSRKDSANHDSNLTTLCVSCHLTITSKRASKKFTKHVQ